MAFKGMQFQVTTTSPFYDHSAENIRQVLFEESEIIIDLYNKEKWLTRFDHPKI